MARSKKISDRDILSKAAAVILTEGFESFTFQQVGKAVGLSPAALVKRFKSKKRLATLARNQRWDENLSRMSDEAIHSLSGLDGIFDFLRLIALSVNSKRLGEHARWLGTEACEPQSKRKVAAYFQTTRSIFSRLLSEAIEMKQLSDQIDPIKFAKTMEALVQGAIFQFAFLEDRNIEAHLKNHIELILEAFVLPPLRD